ncbi:hypothetical protein ACFFGR_15840 [Arthrobacter liuii]|uniref:Uncharacterized protein n=1 Tax=Arthrobacter liuii TaxID=1476996 RepID=A0ABQ2AQY6_9MICC|nr:hypothetical protein [Arthrobacter liuii]GGH95695.1 hypothetical protein GCM10007170_21820 [Arthrobacter liuii]
MAEGKGNKTSEADDIRGRNFIYQEQRSDGTQSDFFRLENPNRQDA